MRREVDRGKKARKEGSKEESREEGKEGTLLLWVKIRIQTLIQIFGAINKYIYIIDSSFVFS